MNSERKHVDEGGRVTMCDSGGGKEFGGVKLRARVYQEATNLMDPLPPPQPPSQPTNAGTESPKPKSYFISKKQTKTHHRRCQAKSMKKLLACRLKNK